MNEPLSTIPTECRDAAQSALTAAFGSAPITGLRPVVGGASGALIYRVDINGDAYLLRIEKRRSAFRNPHQYVCMQTASDAGIAPHVRHVDPEQGVAIMDFIRQRPLTEYPGGLASLSRGAGALIARLQRTPLFPELADYLSLLDRMLGFIRRSGMFAAGLLDSHAAGFERLRNAYPWDASALVSSHNDPNPRNILFDGERLWLVDWELACRNDPLADVAILAENFGSSPESEDALLHAWLGRAPDGALRARLLVMRQFTRLYYAGLILSTMAATPRDAPDHDLTAPSPDEFRAAFAAGRLKIGAPETLYTLGKMCLAGFLSGLANPELERALVVVREN
jgi:aminoglycoside phosphotransferase (APT) family kinase protein